MKEGCLLLADGRRFEGWLLGGSGKPGEVVFTTGMTGYEESFTDPSFTGQIVTMTYPLIGNYGTNRRVRQGDIWRIHGAVVAELTMKPSNWESEGTLLDAFQEWNIPILCGADTRALTKAIRSEGTPMGILTTLAEEVSAQDLLTISPARDQVAQVTTPVTYKMGDGNTQITVIDCGIKRRMLEAIIATGCRVTVVPAFTTAETILATRPDAVWVSNGPGNPADVSQIIDEIRVLIGKVPLFGVCMGHQLLASALGAKTYALPFGHRGANHPVIEVETGKIAMTSQNHGYAVADEDLPSDIIVTERSLHDGTIEGFRHRTLPIRGVQFHPEAAPGPTDYLSLFQDWIGSLQGGLQ